MNHPEESLNPLYPWIEPDLEARLVALVLGEASDFEREELARLIDEKPELALFKNRMETLHVLLKEAATGEPLDDRHAWKLSPDRRETVLATIDGAGSDRDLFDPPLATLPARKRKRLFPFLLKIAATILVLGGLGFLLVPATLPLHRKSVEFAGAAFTLEAPALRAPEHGERLSETRRERGMNSARFAARIDTETVDRKPAAPKADAQASLAELRSNLALVDSTPPVAPPPPPSAKPDNGLAVDSADYGRAVSEIDGKEKQELSMPDVSLALGAGGDFNVSGYGGAALNGDSADVRLEKAADSSLSASGSVNVGGGFLGVDGASAAMEGRSAIPADAFAVTARPETAPSGPFAAPASSTVPEGSDPFAAPAPVSAPAPAKLAEPVIAGAATGAAAKAMEVPLTAAPAAPAAPPADEAKKRIAPAAPSVSAIAQSVETAPSLGTVPALGILLEKKQEAAKTEAAPSRGFGSGGTAGDPFTESSLDGDRGLRANDYAFAPAVPAMPAPAADEVFSEESLRERMSAMDREPEYEERDRALAVANSGSIRAAGETRAGGRIELDELVDTKDKVVRRDLKELKPADNLRTQESALAPAEPIPAWNRQQAGSPVVQFGKAAADFSAGEFLSLSQREGLERLAVPPTGLEEISAGEEAFSTFSLHVSDVSFKLAQAALAKGEWPEAATVRIEEFVNAFDYGDPMPGQEEQVACRLEQAIHPFLQQRNLLRVSMRTAAEGRSGGTPLRLTLLLDNSGSMERPDRQETVRRAFALLAAQLQPIDQITLIRFARQPRLLADKVPGDNSGNLVELVSNLPSEGGTNLEAALRLGFEKAREQQAGNAQNRVVLFTDGAANLGDAEPESLAGLVETLRNTGIAFDAAGIGAEGLNDEILEALTRKGDGRYYLLDRPEDADDGFARQIAGALRPAARNVKVQIEWNPARVGQYKLLGFEKHRLKKEDFRDDSVDAAEMAAAEAGVAVYQFEAKAGGIGDAGSVSVRFQDMASGRMVEKRWPIPYDPAAARLEQAAPATRIAGVAALFAAKLKGDPLGEVVDLKTLAELVSDLPQRYQTMERVEQLRQMIEQARQIAGE